MPSRLPRAAGSPVILRPIYMLLGLVFLSLGVVGVLIPGLPGTPFLLVAVWLFSMSNERLHNWMLSNRWFGHLLADYRAGLGIPRRIKAVAIGSVVVAVTVSVTLGVTDWRLRILLIALALAGITFILTRPTREDVYRTVG